MELGSAAAVDEFCGRDTDSLAVGGTYLIMGEVSYLYVPTVGYVMSKSGITLTSTAYTRPRQTLCVTYPTPPAGTPLPPCPKL